MEKRTRAPGEPTMHRKKKEVTHTHNTYTHHGSQHRQLHHSGEKKSNYKCPEKHLSVMI